jgi:hypothetical protein
MHQRWEFRFQGCEAEQINEAGQVIATWDNKPYSGVLLDAAFPDLEALSEPQLLEPDYVLTMKPIAYRGNVFYNTTLKQGGKTLFHTKEPLTAQDAAQAVAAWWK